MKTFEKIGMGIFCSLCILVIPVAPILAIVKAIRLDNTEALIVSSMFTLPCLVFGGFMAYLTGECFIGNPEEDKKKKIDEQIIAEYNREKNLIQAIKLHRNLTGEGLRESKEYVEKLVNYIPMYRS